MSKIYIVTKRESGKYEEDGVWFSILAAFDTRNKAEEYLKEYERTAPKEAYYTFYRIESVSLFLSSHKVKINRPKHTTYPIGEFVKLKISGEKQFRKELNNANK